ncbi:Gfo/Idh/MocA family oxidoreductase [Frigoribacterium sp. CFBP 13729]|jgi:predicted dehydrogenase|uniref:Gfo/Idh/MocA family protein n=1 Tax=unclassified Frigoribacterium TaxID=2627005 RepID=UPI00177BAF89|nr:MULTISPECIES: Gfo/Idh/MocA family oxidoreductase [unclassified Frigoribacterium]MBD8585005.1 Gfo/Idh/MocA family oxidoreductase [Frigoribacterium sp. CFBP 8766]MBD8609763.1 Gfo/Idh/MocA family oxidoreductase [Frigoribacterium sp. CFBP 13729]
MSIRWGILGAGGIADTFVNDLAAAGIAVAAVGSRDADKAKRFAEDHGITTAHGSYDDLVADPEVDAVYVATPHVFHEQNALLAIRAGKHVLVEKPFTVSADEAGRVLAAAREAGVVALEAMWTRYLPQQARLREVVRSGVIGEPRLLTASHMQSLPTDPQHRLNDPALGGGALLDLGVYPVSFAHDLLGPVEAVAATAVLSDQGVDRRTGITLRHANGATSNLFCALDTAGRNDAVLHGSAGRIEIDHTFYAPGGFTVLDADGEVVERFDSDEGDLRGMQHQALELARLAEAGELESPALTSDGIVAVMATMDEVRRQVGVQYPER